LVLVDTGVFVAAADRDTADHARSSAVLREHGGTLTVPAPVVPETAWLIERRLGPGAEARFLRLVTSRRIDVVDLTLDDYARCVELIEVDADLGLGFVDASVVAIGERLGITELATLNRRDFTVVRPRHVDAFDIVP
jgi:predicted nucleic acid-binding protein